MLPIWCFSAVLHGSRKRYLKKTTTWLQRNKLEHTLECSPDSFSAAIAGTQSEYAKEEAWALHPLTWQVDSLWRVGHFWVWPLDWISFSSTGLLERPCCWWSKVKSPSASWYLCLEKPNIVCCQSSWSEDTVSHGWWIGVVHSKAPPSALFLVFWVHNREGLSLERSSMSWFECIHSA